MSAAVTAAAGLSWHARAKRELYDAVDRFAAPVAAMYAAAGLKIGEETPTEAMVAGQLRDMIAKLDHRHSEVFSDFFSVWAYSSRGEWGMSFTFDLVSIDLVREREVKAEPPRELVARCGCGADLLRHGTWRKSHANAAGAVTAAVVCECGRTSEVLRHAPRYQVFTSE